MTTSTDFRPDNKLDKQSDKRVQDSDMSSTAVGKGRKHFVMVCIAFILPIVLAKLALEQQWFNYGVTNQGQLLEEPISISQLGLSDIQSDKSWLIIYNQAQSCAKACQQTFNLLSNTYTALGKEMPRVEPVALTSDENQTILSMADKSGRWQFHQVAKDHKLLSVEQVLIVDPLGNVVMTHQIPTDEKNLPAFGKSILTDMKKLLKYSRIG